MEYDVYGFCRTFTFHMYQAPEVRNTVNTIMYRGFVLFAMIKLQRATATQFGISIIRGGFGVW
jgi:hypothetical protein